MAFLLYLVVYCLKSCHIHCVTYACWCISIGSADELGQRMSAASPSYQASSGVQMANDTVEALLPFLSFKNRALITTTDTKKISNKQRVLHERWSSEETQFWKFTWKYYGNLCGVFHFLDTLLCGCLTLLHCLQKNSQVSTKWWLFWSS